jgi:hypothetical protein
MLAHPCFILDYWVRFCEHWLCMSSCFVTTTQVFEQKSFVVF